MPHALNHSQNEIMELVDNNTLNTSLYGSIIIILIYEIENRIDCAICNFVQKGKITTKQKH